MSEAVKNESLYSSLIATLDEYSFFKILSRELKASSFPCEIIKSSIPVSKEESRLIYSNKNHSKIRSVICHIGSCWARCTI